MPCRTDDYRESYEEKEIKVLTVMLCSACAELESQKYDFSKNPLLDEWWDRHKAQDRKRKEQEAKELFEKNLAMELSKKSISELTFEEKRLLHKHKYLDLL